jgi:peptide/nickel transport system substrate-binding protein
MPERMAEMAVLSASTVKHGDITFDLANGCGVTGEWPTLARFNSGEDAVGTGPFKLIKYTKGAGVEMARNDAYWGEKPAWEKVTLLPVPNAGPRLAGLLAGNYDLIENPAARDVKQLQGDANFVVTIRPSNRIIFLQMDVSKDKSPSVVTENGANPFKDERVRRAVSMAIDRDTIVKRIMDGAAAPASQFAPETMFGAQPNPEPLVYDPQGAKKLLAEAGYPNGFKVTLAATNDRYINDSQVAQAIAQYLNRVGIQTEVDAMTAAIFFTRRSKSEFSISLGGWGSTTGGASSFLQQFVATLDKDRGVGRSNYGGWSDPAFDEVILKAIATVDETKRAELLREAGKLTLKKLPDIPIHFESTIWGSARASSSKAVWISTRFRRWPRR